MLRLLADGIEKAFGDRAVLRGASLAAHDGDRIGLVGVNGSGKSTLLRILGGRQDPDQGRVVRHGRMAVLDQEPDVPGETVGEALDLALDWHQRLLDAYQEAVGKGDMSAAAAAQDQIERVGWQLSHTVDAMALHLGVVARDTPIAQLSGGELRRLALARALLGKPEVLVLDEPTNHLDAETIEWLQATLESWTGVLVFVTHDRYLLEAVATRIVEIEDGITVAYEGSYGDYLVASAERQALLGRTEDKRLEMIAREAAWAARSPAARSTKQKARLKRLDELQNQRGYSTRSDFVLDLSTGFRKGGPLLEVHRARKAYGDNVLFEGLELSIKPGDRVGILGPNGVGKSTLLHVLSGGTELDRGELVLAPRLKVAVLDQHRSGLELEATVFDNAGNGNDWVHVGDTPMHVASFLERFLFPREMFAQRVFTLSGGERARLLLAKLLLHGANLILLDEPTNDLDLMTLRVLEEALLSYDGAAVVVTHDRAFLDRTCTRVLAFEGGGRTQEYADRLQAHRAYQALQAAEKAEVVRPAAPKPPPPAAPAKKPGRLSWREEREFEELPARIEALEAELAALGERLADPALYKEDAATIAAVTEQATALPRTIEAAYARWEELEERAGG